jgi:hypothetical protein
MFADDLTLLARLKWGLDSMLSTVSKFGNLWHLVFNINEVFADCQLYVG